MAPSTSPTILIPVTISGGSPSAGKPELASATASSPRIVTASRNRSTTSVANAVVAETGSCLLYA